MRLQFERENKLPTRVDVRSVIAMWLVWRAMGRMLGDALDWPGTLGAGYYPCICTPEIQIINTNRVAFL